MTWRSNPQRAVLFLLACGVAFGQIGLPRGRSTSRPGREQAATLPASTTTGMIRKVDPDWLILEADDHRIISFRLNAQTVLQKQAKPAKTTDFRPGDHVTVDASATEQGQLVATTISFDKAGTNGEYARASRPVEDTPYPVRQAERNGGGSGDPDDEKPRLRRGDAKSREKATDENAEPQQPAAASAEETEPAVRDRPTTIVQDKDELENERPRVRRGMPAPHPRSDTTEIAEATTPPPPAPATRPKPQPTPEPEATARTLNNNTSAPAAPAERGSDPFIEQTREALEHFTEGLPNYTVQQLTTRYFSDTPKAQFKAQDVVSADVVVVNGSERYRNIKVNNRDTKKSMEETGGSWSTGEFATTIMDVFSPASHADFRFRRNQSTANRPARVYDYQVARENSHWRVFTTSQTYRPAYKGRVWIDTETHLVLRLEMEALGLPQDFPLDHVEMTLDYDFVRLSGPSFLLPVQSENLSCQRGTPYCSKNTTDFRNYRKYSSESSVTYTP